MSAARAWSVRGGEQVGLIFPGEVTLTITAADAQNLQPYREAPPETVFRPEKPSLGARVSKWLGGKC